jgi:histidine ammonia-lyase
VLACELVAAIRGLRLRRLVPAPGPLRDAYEVAAPVLDTRITDRPLDADIDAAEGVLASLAQL